MIQSSDFAARLNKRYYYSIDNGSLLSHESRNFELAEAAHVQSQTCNLMNNKNTPNDSLTGIDNGSLMSDEGGNCELAVAALVLTCNMMNAEITPNDSLTNIDNGSLLTDESENRNWQ